ncbi:MAG: Arginine--tRNA ligase [Parcubacteria bacterium OLB19]|nr:MAG: Arginine--tRNA ligase [Parcubacteria bacterium OLB19]
MEKVIRTAINDVLASWGFTEVNFAVEHPAELTHGDYATNVAMVVAKRKGEAPRQVAEQLVAALQDQIEYVEKIEIAGPGFINFFLSRDFFASEVARVKTLSDAWGRNDNEIGQLVMMEYTSPNLFKPLHIGNLVGNIIGESISRLFEFSGAEVKRINYPSDIGLTVAKGVWGLKKQGGDPDDIVALGKAYVFGNEAYENVEEAKKDIDDLNKVLYEGSNEELNEIRRIGIATSLRRLAELCGVLGTKFDLQFFESEVSVLGKDTVLQHVGDVFKESEGAIVYEGEKVGLHTRVFLNSKGLPTYEAKDLGNFLTKQKTYPDWTKSIIITGNEQREYFQVLFAVIKELFTDVTQKDLEHISTGFLTLTTGKMSSRKGNVLTGESLLAEIQNEARIKAENTRTDDVEAMTEMVAVAALKYQILRQNPGSNIIFDKEKSLSFEGDSGPYLQYTYARINSVLEKAKQAGLELNTNTYPDAPYEIEKIIYRFPEVIEEALVDRAPHKVVGYLTELAGEFNSFYAHEKIADKEDINAPYKIAIAEAVKTTLENGLWILGIKAPERM